MAVAYRSILELAILFLLSFIIAFIPLLKLIVDVVRKGPGRMFWSRPQTVRPPVLQKSDYGTHLFVRLPQSRVKLHCVVNGADDKPLMLFLHGFPEFWYSWRHQLKEFSRDYRVVACDMRGYGDSDKPSGVSEYTFDKLVDDIDQLITELGYDKCILVAHDWGALIAWGYAALHQDRLDRLIICNCPLPNAFEIYIQKQKAFSQLRKSWYILFFQQPFLPELTLWADSQANYERFILCSGSVGARRGTFTAEDMEAFKYTFSTYSDWSGPINYYRAMNRFMCPEVEESWKKKIAVPTLIIWGTNDGFLDTQLAEFSSQLVEQCEIKYIDGGSHWIQQEDPEQVNELIQQFLLKDL